MSISTDWELTHFDNKTSDFQSNDWRPANVPGCVQTSPFGLPREQLYRETNIRTVQWMEEKWWVYRRRLDVPKPGTDEIVRLVFTGLDYKYRVFINGELCVDDEGMFHDVIVPLDKFAGRSVEAIVAFDPPPRALADHRATTKAQFARSWDWAPVLRTVGIWDEVILEVVPRFRITNAFIETKLHNQQRALVTVHAEFSERVERATAVIELAGTRREVPLFDTDRLSAFVEVFSPRLWWPNGLGEPTLHELRITIQGTTFVQHVGLREVSRVPARDQRPEDIPLQFVTNGLPFFINGLNWVPADSCIGDLRDEQYDRPLEQFAAGHVNLVRVWGGGLCEKRRFYERCDELGLLVYQEYPVSFGVTDSERAYRQLHRESTHIARKLRHHASVFLFSGGNENYICWDALDTFDPAMQEAAVLARKAVNEGKPFANREWLTGTTKQYDEPAHLILGSITAAHAPHCLYQNTSAMENEGEVHGTWNWNPQIGDHRYRMHETHYNYWRAADLHLYSECSVSSIANLETIRAVTDSFPTPQNETWKLHHAFHAAWDNLPDLWLDLPSTEKIFGKITDLRELVILNQFIQAEGGRFMIEELRRKQPHTTGIIWWGANEPWPGLAGNALIDYFGRAKSSWPCIANAFKPTILSLRYDALQPKSLRGELWLSCNDRHGFEGRYEVKIGNDDRYEGRCAAAYGQSLPLKRLPRTPVAGEGCVKVNTKLYDASDKLVHENQYFFGDIRAEVLKLAGKT